MHNQNAENSETKIHPKQDKTQNTKIQKCYTNTKYGKYIKIQKQHKQNHKNTTKIQIYTKVYKYIHKKYNKCT